MQVLFEWPESPHPPIILQMEVPPHTGEHVEIRKTGGALPRGLYKVTDVEWDLCAVPPAPKCYLHFIK